MEKKNHMKLVFNIYSSTDYPLLLFQVRSLFYNVYVSAIGLNFSNGRNESGLGTLVSNFAQKVGIKPMSGRNT